MATALFLALGLIGNYVAYNQIDPGAGKIPDSPFDAFQNPYNRALNFSKPRVLTMAELIELEEQHNANVPRLRKQKSITAAEDMDDLLSKIKTEYDNEPEAEPKADEENDVLSKTKNNQNKFLLIHVGPQATGMKRIQKDTALNKGLQKALAKDNVLFVGKYAPKDLTEDFFTNEACAQDFVRVSLGFELLEKPNNLWEDIPVPGDLPLREQFCNSKKCLTDCWSNLDRDRYQDSEEDPIAAIEALHDETSNQEDEKSNGKRMKIVHNMLDFDGMLQMDEKMSWKDLGEFKDRFNFLNAGFWKEYLDYDVIGVTTYRRYYSWILAVYNELVEEYCLAQPDPSDLDKLLDKKKIADWGPIEENTIQWSLSNAFRKRSIWPKHGGNTCPEVWEFILPHLHRKDNNTLYDSRIFRNLDTLIPVMNEALRINSTEPYGNITMMNYFQRQDDYNSITTEFYCEILGMDKTPNACEYAKANFGPNGVKVALVSPKVIYDKIVVAAQERGILGKKINAEDRKILNFNTTTNATLNNNSDTKATIPYATQRIRLRNELIKHHTETLQKTHADLPLLCPLRSELQHLLEKSVEFENLVMPELAQSPIGEETHIADFWDSHDLEKTFCWVDTDRLLKGTKTWDDILQALTKQWGMPKRIRINRVWTEE